MTPTLGVQVIGWTQFQAPDGVAWTTDTDGGQALVEFAGRACYQSWDKPNPATATNAGYLRHILDVGHFSVLEHGVATVYVTGVSRSLTHELVRHRHFSYSQLSQRFVNNAGAMVEPEVIARDPYLHRVFTEAADNAERAYHELLHGLDRTLTAGASTGRRKAVRQAARSVLPNATETRIVVTGNYRAWRHFITLRATEHADVEIRALAVACLVELTGVAPHVFGDYQISPADGGPVASTRYREES